MKTFKDLEFEEKGGMMGGYRARLDFDNGYGVSVISGHGAYADGKHPYELAILKDGFLCYDTEITNDVIGHLNSSGVTNMMKRVQSL